MAALPRTSHSIALADRETIKANNNGRSMRGSFAAATSKVETSLQEQIELEDTETEIEVMAKDQPHQVPNQVITHQRSNSVAADASQSLK